MSRTVPSQDPESTFRRFTRFLDGRWCDQASVVLLTGARLARWVEQPVLMGGIPMPIGRRIFAEIGSIGGWTVTIYIPGGTGASAEPGTEPSYIAAITCTWRGRDEPTLAMIAAISAHGRATAAQTCRTAAVTPGDPVLSQVSRFGLSAAS